MAEHKEVYQSSGWFLGRVFGRRKRPREEDEFASGDEGAGLRFWFMGMVAALLAMGVGLRGEERGDKGNGGVGGNQEERCKGLVQGGYSSEDGGEKGLDRFGESNAGKEGFVTEHGGSEGVVTGRDVDVYEAMGLSVSEGKDSKDNAGVTENAEASISGDKEEFDDLDASWDELFPDGITRGIGGEKLIMLLL